LLASPLARAQQRQGMRRIGILSTSSQAGNFPRTFPGLLRRLGYEEGRNLAIEWRLVAGDSARLQGFAEELVRLNPELIVAHNNESVAAMKRATKSIPVVMVTAWEPVANGFVDNLARPGGNITGAVWVGAEHMGKLVQLVTEALPKAKRIASLWDPTYPGSELAWQSGEAASKSLGVTLDASFHVARLEELDDVLKRIAVRKPDAILLPGVGVMFAAAARIAEFAIERKLPAFGNNAFFVDRGALMAHAPVTAAIYERGASYVDRILRGAKPGELPVENPTVYELAFNVKTAREIGYQIPQNLRAQVDRVVE
jgi:putative ABC transport system substrate-binding protein